MNTSNSPGLYGKVPALGDFVTRRLPGRFVETWDAWLRAALSKSREQLNSRWLDIYLTSPIWRFILSPGICDNNAWAGILMPSVDNVGRHFPLTLAVMTGNQQTMTDTFIIAVDWFERLEQLALSALEDEFNITDFDRKLQKQTLQVPLQDDQNKHSTGSCIKKEGKFAFQIVMESPEQIADAHVQLSNCLLTEILPAYSMWNTASSELVKPLFLVYEDLPPREVFSELLVAQRKSEEDFVGDADSIYPDLVSRKAYDNIRLRTNKLKGQRIHWHSSGRSSAGKQRKVNEDAFLERPEVGIWAVADGMGGHLAGDVASSAVVDSLATLAASGNLETLTAAAAECLHNVNTDLLAMADKLGSGQIIGTTVVVMLAAGERCASIWAGDSRLYRLREGELLQLTHDHSLTAEASQQRGDSERENDDVAADHIITRAIGAEPELSVDTVSFEAKVGDRYLLCSDGLVKEIGQQDITTILSHGNCEESSQNLIDLTLARGARDNVTVIVVHADYHEPSVYKRNH